VGDFVPNINFDALHAKVKAENPDIAWLSVYMHGTTAEVQMRETKHPSDLSHPGGTYANVIASEAGEIVSVRVYEGQAAVQAGDVVLPGELLISGVVDGKEAGSARTEYAAGEVLARVCRPISVEVSCIREKTVYTGRETVKKSVKFFKNTINLFGNTGIPYATYDTIDMMEEVCLFDRFSVPVTIFFTVVRETETAVETLTPEEAAEEAMGILRAEMDRAIGTGEMLSRTVETSVLEDGGCRIDCVLYLLQDIAGTEEFTVHPGAYPSSDIQNQ
jgi:similar to stage IV sporulation protein